MIVRFIVVIGFFAIIWQYLSPGVTVISVGVLPGSIVYGLFLRRRRQAKLKEINQVQTYAHELTQADIIGSAIHVAGHPLFEREEPIVLALKQQHLSIHNYQNRNPIAVIKINDIKAVSTVVYDEDRIPHIDVIDNTAQALQVVIA